MTLTRDSRSERDDDTPISRLHHLSQAYPNAVQLSLNSYIYQIMDVKPTDVKPVVEEQTTWPFPVEIQEQLAIDQGKSVKNVWALKLPRFLLERWERVPEAGVELGTLVVDSSYVGSLGSSDHAHNQNKPTDDPLALTGRSLSRRPGGSSTSSRSITSSQEKKV